jgi:hypothetical protein
MFLEKAMELKSSGFGTICPVEASTNIKSQGGMPILPVSWISICQYIGRSSHCCTHLNNLQGDWS